MHKPNNKSNQGFTIIEVMLVLAIAGLIMLIVFLAVPALQRNSRNTQRKNDVSAILGALSEYVSNNAGQLPADNTAFGNAESNVKFAYYTADQVTYTRQTSATNPGTNGIDADTVRIYTYAKCNGNTPTNANATARSYIALYAVETSGSPQVQCQES